MEYKTLNFMAGYDVTSLPAGTHMRVDMRNGITCYAPSMDLQCYLNYIRYLNLCQNEWVSTGYLDLGMVPLAMLPSFFPEEFKDVLASMAKQIGIDVYSMPPVSNLKGTYRGTVNDIWVFREELAKILHVPEKNATLSKWLEQIISVTNSKTVQRRF